MLAIKRNTSLILLQSKDHSVNAVNTIIYPFSIFLLSWYTSDHYWNPCKSKGWFGQKNWNIHHTHTHTHTHWFSSIIFFFFFENNLGAWYPKNYFNFPFWMYTDDRTLGPALCWSVLFSILFFALSVPILAHHVEKAWNSCLQKGKMW